MPPAMFPKVAVVCGASTELGKLVIRDLLRSPYVDRVHALAEYDPRDEISAHPANMRKLRLHIDSLDYVDRTVNKFIHHADIAFVTIGSSKDDLATKGPFAFHRDNFDVPRRFILCMFDLAVQRIAVLSADGASPYVRGNEFLKVKGELVQVIIELLRDVGRYAPAVALFRVPFLLTNKVDLHGRQQPAPIFNQIKQHAVLKFDVGPAQAVHIRDVAKAMVADTLANAEREEESDLAFRFKKRQYDLTELWGPDIVSLANQTRALQKSSYQRRKDKEAVEQRISQFARQEGALKGENQDDEDDSMGGSHSGEDALQANDSQPPSQEGSKVSEVSGSQLEGTKDGDSHVSGEEDPPHVNYAGPPSVYDGSVPSSRPSSAIRRAQAAPVGTIESLGQQLSRRPIRIRNNEILPDIEHTRPSWGPQSRVSGEFDSAGMYGPGVEGQEFAEYGEYVEEHLDGELYNDEEEYASNVSGEHSIPSRRSDDDPLHGYGLDEGDVGHLPSDIYDPMKDFRRRQSYGAHEGRELLEAEMLRRRRFQSNAADPYAEESASPALNRRRSYHSSSRRHGIRAGQHRRDLDRRSDEAQGLPPMQRFSALVGRIIAATDRPSHRRRRRMPRMIEEQPYEEEFFDEFDEDDGFYDEPPLRGDGDMREADNVEI